MEVLERLLQPVLKDAVPRGVPLQLWQMRRTTWDAIVATGGLAYGSALGLERQNLTNPEPPFTLHQWLRERLVQTLGYGTQGPPLSNGDINSRHELHVLEALAADKPVPAAVMDDMLQGFSQYDRNRDFAQALVDRPFLRGQATAEQTRVLLQVYEGLGRAPKAQNAPAETFPAITPETAGPLFSIVRRLEASPTHQHVDNALYAAGWLQPLPVPLLAQPADDEPLYRNAVRLQQALESDRRADYAARANEELASGRISKRRHELQVAQAEHVRIPSKWPNQVVAALEEKDLAMLLSIADHPDDQNRVSRRFAREHYGFNTLGLKSAARHDAVFRFCGLDAARQKAWEEAEATRKAAVIAQKDAEDRRERVVGAATRSRVRTPDGTISTWKEIIDKAVADGHTEITSGQKGATRKYFLMNPVTRLCMPVQRKDGSLDYAEMAVADQKLELQRVAHVPAAGDPAERELAEAGIDVEEAAVERPRGG